MDQTGRSIVGVGNRPRTLQARARHGLAFGGLCAFTVLLYLRPNELFPNALGEVPIVKSVALLALTVYLLSKLAVGEAPVRGSVELGALVVIALLGVAHIPFAASPEDSVNLLGDVFLKILLIFVLLIHLLDTPGRVKTLMWLTVVCGAVLAGGAIRSYLAGEFHVGGTRIRGMVGGIFANPNDLALNFAMLLPLAAALSLTTRGIPRLLLLGCAALFLVGVTITYSRGGFFGLVAMGMVLLWKFGRGRRIPALAAGLVVVGLFVAFMPGDYDDRLATVVDTGADKTGSAQARRELLDRAVEVALAHPVIGVGMGNFHVYSIQEHVAHNSYLEISAELGVLGLLAYLLLIFHSLALLRRVERDHPPDSDLTRLSQGIQASFAAYIVCSFFASIQYQWYLYYIAAYAAALGRINPAPAAREVPRARALVRPSIAVGTALMLTAWSGVLARTDDDPTVEAVTWNPAPNIRIQGNTVTKTSACDGCRDARAISREVITEGLGYVEFSPATQTGTRRCGLARQGQTTDALPYSVDLWPTYFEIREGGAYRADGTYKVGDVFRIAASKDGVSYTKNGDEVFVNSAAPTFPLVAVAELLSVGSSIENVMMGFPTSVTVSPTEGRVVSGGTLQFSATVTGPANQSVAWSASSGTLEPDGTFKAGAPGTVTIAATSVADARRKATATVTVVDAATATNPPVLSDIAAKDITSTSAAVVWTTNKPSTRVVRYGTTADLGQSVRPEPVFGLDHRVVLTGLAPRTTYYFRAVSRDEAGNQTASDVLSFTTLPDLTPPKISNLSVGGIGESAATVTWTTDKPADGQVEFGISSTLGTLSPVATANDVSHRVALADLKADTVYFLRVRSRDESGNLGVSETVSFRTLPDTTPPVVSAVVVSAIAVNGVTVSWTTNEASDTQVEFGPTTEYGNRMPTDGSALTRHSMLVTGLTDNTTYHLRVGSRDAAGNLGMSSDLTITTPKLKTDGEVYPESSAPNLPGAGGTFVDPTFGTLMMRLTDEADGATNTVQYSYWPSFNRDTTRIMISTDRLGATLYDFNPTTFKVSGKRSLFRSKPPDGEDPRVEDAIWSGVNPDVIFTHTSTRLWGYNVATNTWTLVRNFAEALPASGNIWQMSRSLDDGVFAFTRQNSKFEEIGYLVWRRGTDTLLKVETTQIDEVQIDKTGQWLVVKTGLEGKGAVRVRVTNLTTGTTQDVLDGDPDFAPGHSDNGRGTVVGNDNWNNRLTFRLLAAPLDCRTVVGFGEDWSMDLHISTLAENENWVVVSTFKGDGQGRFHREIIQAATDGSERVRRLAHNRTVYREYWDTPRANISRDGRFIIFSSNWGTPGRRDVFILNLSGVVAP